MAYFLQQLINGLTLGAIYGLIAIGYTMVYGIVKLINFAHGEIYMIGAFVGLVRRASDLSAAPGHAAPGAADLRDRAVDLPAAICAADPGRAG